MHFSYSVHICFSTVPSSKWEVWRSLYMSYGDVVTGKHHWHERAHKVEISPLPVIKSIRNLLLEWRNSVYFFPLQSYFFPPFYTCCRDLYLTQVLLHFSQAPKTTPRALLKYSVCFLQKIIWFKLITKILLPVLTVRWRPSLVFQMQNFNCFTLEDDPGPLPASYIYSISPFSLELLLSS